MAGLLCGCRDCECLQPFWEKIWDTTQSQRHILMATSSHILLGLLQTRRHRWTQTKCCEVSPGVLQGWGGPMVRGVWGRVVVHTHYRAFHVGELDLHMLLWGTMLVLGFAPVLHPSWINTWLCGNNAQVISSIHESRLSLKRKEVLFCTLAHGGHCEG